MYGCNSLTLKVHLLSNVSMSRSKGSNFQKTKVENFLIIYAIDKKYRTYEYSIIIQYSNINSNTN